MRLVVLEAMVVDEMASELADEPPDHPAGTRTP
jgi:hypothetical protein